MTSPEAFACRSCGARESVDVLDLGETPLANALLTEGDLVGTREERFPLDLVFCPRCSLVQITETVPPEILFRNYVYFSSFSETMLAHAQQLAADVIRSRSLNGASLVLEAASNDGYLLRNYVSAGVPVLGVDPAVNVARVATERGVPTLAEFFGPALARRLAAEGKRADVFHAHNVLAHVADLNGFVGAVASILKTSGVAIVEVPYVRDMIEHVEFDTIYHEHLCYFSLHALDVLFARAGLRIVDVTRVAIHGGSLRIYASPVDSAPSRSAAVLDLLAEEVATGLDRQEYYQDFAQRVWALRDSLLAHLRALKTSGARIAAYGASAKGSTLLNAFNIGPDLLDFVVDRSTHKQGKFTPGVHLPIFGPEKLLADRPGYVLLLTWNFRDEILSQQRAYHDGGGRFIIPVPEVKVV